MFDVREKGILLCLVEMMDFIHQEGHGDGQAMEALRLFKNVFKLLDPRGDGRELNAADPAGCCQEPCQSGFPAPWWSPEDKRVEATCLSYLPKQFSRVEQMPLADKFVQGQGPHSLG